MRHRKDWPSCLNRVNRVDLAAPAVSGLASDSRRVDEHRISSIRANSGLIRRSKQRPIDHLVGDRRTQFTQATPLSEDPQSTASRLIARPGR